jgi:hypothetical protein
MAIREIGISQVGLAVQGIVGARIVHIMSGDAALRQEMGLSQCLRFWYP